MMDRWVQGTWVDVSTEVGRHVALEGEEEEQGEEEVVIERVVMSARPSRSQSTSRVVLVRVGMFRLEKKSSRIRFATPWTFCTKSSGVVLVAWKGEVDGIGRRWGGWVFDVGKSLRFQVCSVLEGSLSSGILWTDLDFLTAEDVRPIVAC